MTAATVSTTRPARRSPPARITRRGMEVTISGRLLVKHQRLSVAGDSILHATHGPTHYSGDQVQSRISGVSCKCSREYSTDLVIEDWSSVIKPGDCGRMRVERRSASIARW